MISAAHVLRTRVHIRTNQRSKIDWSLLFMFSIIIGFSVSIFTTIYYSAKYAKAQRGLDDVAEVFKRQEELVDKCAKNADLPMVLSVLDNMAVIANDPNVGNADFAKRFHDEFLKALAQEKHSHE